MPPRALNSPVASDDVDSDLDNISDQGSDDDDDFLSIRSVIARPGDNATNEDLRKALADSHKVLIAIRGKLKVLETQVAVHDARESKRRGKKVANLSGTEMSVELQTEAIRTLGRKYSMTHCFWVNPEIFPLATNPSVDLKCAERWLSPLSIEDAVKTEIFLFVPKDFHPLMGHKNFGTLFCAGVQTIRSESVSDVKGSAGTIFGLNAEFFVRGYSRFDEPKCRELLLGANGKYTKFAPVLFPDPKSLRKDQFLKTAILVKILKVTLFGRSSLSGQNAPGPRPKGRIWELRSTTAGMIAAAGILALFVLSGDPNFYQTGEKTGIPYSVYHNYFRQQLVSGSPWAQSVFKFFDAALFPDSSKSAPASGLAATVDDDLDWEAEFERAFADGLSDHAPGPAFVGPSISAPAAAVAAPADKLDAVRANAPADHGPAPAFAAIPPVPQAARADVPLDIIVDDLDNDLPAVMLRPPPKVKGVPKPKRKGAKANAKGATTNDDGGADAMGSESTSATSARRSGRALRSNP